jgi:hypothetical protein
MLLIILYILYVIYQFIKYKYPHYGLHSKPEYNGFHKGVDIFKLFDYKSCGCTVDEIQGYKRKCKIKIIISILIPILLVAMVYTSNYLLA